jgi:hypothetical protein
MPRASDDAPDIGSRLRPLFTIAGGIFAVATLTAAFGSVPADALPYLTWFLLTLAVITLAGSLVVRAALYRATRLVAPREGEMA